MTKEEGGKEGGKEGNWGAFVAFYFFISVCESTNHASKHLHSDGWDFVRERVFFLLL